jgi:transposase
MGARTKLTPERVARLVEALEAGNYDESAARYAGISRSIYYAWLARGRKERDRLTGDEKARPLKSEEPFLDFLDKVEEAIAKAEVRNVAIIQKAGNTTWQASAWWLERKMPNKWGRHDKQELVGDGGGAIAINISTDDLEAKVEQVLSKRNTPSE